MKNAAEKQQTISEKKVIGRPFPPGVSGNPAGRPPKGHSITEMISSMMNEQPEIKKAIGTKILALALEGDTTALKMIWQYMDGMPTQNTNLHVDKEPIPILGQDVPNNDSDKSHTGTDKTD